MPFNNRCLRNMFYNIYILLSQHHFVFFYQELHVNRKKAPKKKVSVMKQKDPIFKKQADNNEFGVLTLVHDT